MFASTMATMGTAAAANCGFSMSLGALGLALVAPVMIAAGAALLGALRRTLEARDGTVSLHGPSPLPVAGVSSGIA